MRYIDESINFQSVFIYKSDKTLSMNRESNDLCSIEKEKEKNI